MIDNSAIVVEYSDQYTVVEEQFIETETKASISFFCDLELLVQDDETGKPITKAMIGIDSVNRTAVCNEQGRISIAQLPVGKYLIDIIMPGYKAGLLDIDLSGGGSLKRAIVKMIRNS